jgi:hypothetical protein
VVTVRGHLEEERSYVKKAKVLSSITKGIVAISRRHRVRSPYCFPSGVNDGKSGCWLWSLIIFLIQRSLLSVVFIPHEVFTPQKYVHSSTRGSAEGGYPLCGVRGVAGGSGGKRAPSGGSGAKPLKKKLPCKSIL